MTFQPRPLLALLVDYAGARRRLRKGKPVTFRRLLPLLALLAGCAPTLRWDWPPAEIPQAPAPEDFPKASAVILKVHSQHLFWPRYRKESYYEHAEHKAVAVLTEEGFDHARIMIPAGTESEIVFLEARTIGPDGTITPVTRDQIHETTAKGGEDKWEVKSRVGLGHRFGVE